MLKVTKPTTQLDIFGGLGDSLNQKHPLYLLANSINWLLFDDTFKEHYSDKMGAPAKPIRLIGFPAYFKICP